MKRRDSKNLTFDDMMIYADSIETFSEAERLIPLTTNHAVKSCLQEYANQVRSNFSRWLDAEV